MVLKDDRAEQSLRSCGSEFQINVGSKAGKGVEAMNLAFVLLGFQHVGVGKMSCSIQLIKCCLNNMHVECVRYCLL